MLASVKMCFQKIFVRNNVKFTDVTSAYVIKVDFFPSLSQIFSK